MIVCFRCTAETKIDLDRLMASGAYKDIGEVIAAAVRNQVLMEQEVGEKGAIVIGDAHSDVAAVVRPPTIAEKKVSSSLSAPPVTTKNGKPQETSKKTTVVATPVKQQRTNTVGIPEIFQGAGFPTEPPSGLAELPGDMWTNGQKIPLDRWMLGQFNRLLPAKVNARALIRLFLDEPKGLEIASSASKIATNAAILGDFLRKLDEKFETSRDDSLATAFPSAEEGAEKGRTRYANQFVVYQNTKGELSGLMVDLKLINFVQVKKERRIIPTRAAWEFAALANPLLDGDPKGPSDKFSTQEREFLINHILCSVPVEAFAYRVVLEAVREGHTSPEQIDNALKGLLEEGRAESLSQSFLASQRSGAVSRMSDLGLIERRREGVRMFYTATAEGQAFQNQDANHQTR